MTGEDRVIRQATKVIQDLIAMLPDPEGRFAPSHYKVPLLNARKWLDANAEDFPPLDMPWR